MCSAFEQAARKVISAEIAKGRRSKCSIPKWVIPDVANGSVSKQRAMALPKLVPDVARSKVGGPQNDGVLFRPQKTKRTLVESIPCSPQPKNPPSHQ